MTDNPVVSNSPRTDAQCLPFPVGAEEAAFDWVAAEFARELERELAAVKDRSDREYGVVVAALREAREELAAEHAMREDCARIADGYFNKWKEAEAHLAGVVEQCAKVCESLDRGNDHLDDITIQECAHAIRALSPTEAKGEQPGAGKERPR